MATERPIKSAGSGSRKTAGAASWAIVVAPVDGLCRLLAWIVATLQRRQSLASKPRQMQLVESLALGNRRQLLLVICEGRRYLVGAGSDSVGSISVVDGGALPIEEPRSLAGLPIRAMNQFGTRPELERQRVRQTSLVQKPGADRWQ